MRFALLEAKMGIISLLSRYSFKECPETPKTVTFDPAQFLSNALEPLTVKVEQRSEPTMKIVR